MSQDNNNTPAVLPSSINTVQVYAAQLEGGLKLADVFLKSGIVPSHFKSKEAVYVALLWGQELGFSPIQAVNSIEIIQGKPTLPAATIKALIASNGGTIEEVEWSDNICHLRLTRASWAPTDVTYTIDDAKKQGLTSKDNWIRMPKAMLYARCISIGGRNMWADILKGLYSKEEMQDAIVVSPVNTTRTVATRAKDVVIEPVKDVVQTVATTRDRAVEMVERYYKVGIGIEDIEKYLQHDIEDINDAEIDQLWLVFKQIKAHKTTWSETLSLRNKGDKND